MKPRESLKKLVSDFPYLKKAAPDKINKEIYRYLLFFVADKDILVAALIQNPFGKTPGLENLKKRFDKPVAKNIAQLNTLWTSDYSAALKKYTRIKKIILIYLANFVVLFDRYRHDPRTIRAAKAKNVRFALKLLDNLDIDEIRTRLEDDFFSILYPEIYKNYHTLLKFTQKKFLLQQKKIMREFKKILENGQVEAKIQARLKTIYSTHQKIIQKNILFSQVLDTIGLRIIVKTEDDCYRAMVLILKNNPILTSRVKDYIAIPKDNGYQSLHLTILHDNHPVEIQIRTKEMDQRARYGPAAHFKYKKYANENEIYSRAREKP